MFKICIPFCFCNNFFQLWQWEVWWVPGISLSCDELKNELYIHSNTFCRRFLWKQGKGRCKKHNSYFLNGSAIKGYSTPLSLMAVKKFSTNFKKVPKKIYFFLNGMRFTPPPLYGTAIKKIYKVSHKKCPLAIF